MALQKVYSPVNWENYPSDKTPLNEDNLNKIDKATNEIDNRVINIDLTKASKLEVASLVSEITYDDATGIFTVERKDGSSFTIDTKLEKIAINFKYDPATQQIIIILDDGTMQYIDLSALITQYEFLDSAAIAFEIDTAGKVTAKIKNASITEDMLQPNYLADVKIEVAKAKKSQSEAENSKNVAANSADNASLSEANAASSAKTAQSYAVGGTNTRTGEDTDNAKYYSQQADASKNAASTSATNAKASETNAAASANTATSKATDASMSADTASSKANSASNSAIDASTSATNAKASETNAAASANTAQNYAAGDTGSAKYYYEQAKAISESFAGALRPMGTVSFAKLPTLETAVTGDMYNISDEFVTTNSFKEGAGITQPAGTNVYKTTDNMWDCLAGSPVTGIKGANETTFKRGNVNLTAENIGALATNGDTKDTSVTFSAAEIRKNIASGEKTSVIFGKIAKWFSDLKVVALTGSYKDLNDKPVIDASLSTTSTNAIQNKAVSSLVYGKIITANDDWNDITAGYHLANGGPEHPWTVDKHAPVKAYGRGYIFFYDYNNFGYQIYITANNRNVYIRSIFNSEWSEWQECSTPNVSFGTVADVFPHNSSDPYLTKSDGYLIIGVNGYAGQYIIMTIRDKNGVEVDEIVFPDSVQGFGASRSVYVPKDMYIYNKGYNAVTGGIITAIFRTFSRE